MLRSSSSAALPDLASNNINLLSLYLERATIPLIFLLEAEAEALRMEEEEVEEEAGAEEAEQLREEELAL